MEIKKAVLFSKDLSGVGGGERLLFGFAKYLKEKGIETTILTFSFNQSQTFEKIAKDVKVIQVGNYSNKKSFVQKIFSEIPNIWQLSSELKRISPQIIITDGASNASSLYFATLFSNFKYAVHIYETEFWFGNPDDLAKYSSAYKPVFDQIRNSVIGHQELVNPNSPKMGFIKRIINDLVVSIKNKAVAKASVVFTMSNQMAWEVEKMYKRKAVVLKGAFPESILNYIPQKDIKKELGLENKKIILSIGRLIRKKRIDLLIRSFALLNSKDIVLIIGGTGPEEENLKKLAQDLRISEQVFFVGRIDEKEMYVYFSSCDVFAYPDHADFGITPYEALAFNKNVVWSTEMEIDDYLRNNQHIFSAFPKDKEFAQALLEATQKEVVQKYDMRPYSWEQYFAKIYSELEKI